MMIHITASITGISQQTAERAAVKSTMQEFYRLLLSSVLRGSTVVPARNAGTLKAFLGVGRKITSAAGAKS